MNPAKASGFITICQGNPPTASVDFRPLSVGNTKLGELLKKKTAELNEELKGLYVDNSTPTSGFEAANTPSPESAAAQAEIMAPATGTVVTQPEAPAGGEGPKTDEKSDVETLEATNDRLREIAAAENIAVGAHDNKETLQTKIREGRLDCNKERLLEIAAEEGVEVSTHDKKDEIKAKIAEARKAKAEAPAAPTSDETPAATE